MNYLALRNRTDVARSNCIEIFLLKIQESCYWNAAKGCSRYLQSKMSAIFIKEREDLDFIGMSDLDWAGKIPDKK